MIISIWFEWHLNIPCSEYFHCSLQHNSCSVLVWYIRRVSLESPTFFYIPWRRKFTKENGRKITTKSGWLWLIWGKACDFMLFRLCPWSHFLAHRLHTLKHLLYIDKQAGIYAPATLPLVCTSLRDEWQALVKEFNESMQYGSELAPV